MNARPLLLASCALLFSCGDNSGLPADGGPDATTNDVAVSDAPADGTLVSDGGDAGVPPNDGGPNVDATVTDGGTVCGDIPDGGGTCNGIYFQCDDSADCAGQVCCLLVGTNGISGSSCRPSCKTGVPQLCSGTPECASGTCSAQTCKGFVLGICGTIPASCN